MASDTRNTEAASEAGVAAQPSREAASVAAAEKTALEMFSALITDAAPPQEESESPVDEEPKPGQKPKPKPKPKLLKDLGSYASLTDDELYGIEVPSSIEGQEPYTIGKLKDLAKSHDEFTLSTLAQEQRFRDRDAALLRAEQELQDLFAALPKSAITPELRKSLQDKRDQAATEERQRVLEVIPEWQNRDIRTREIGAMIEHLRDYGFPEQYLAGVFDHRMHRYIRANMVREQRIKAALEKVTAKKPSTPSKSARSAAPAKPASPKSKSAGEREIDNFSNVLFQNFPKT